MIKCTKSLHHPRVIATTPTIVGVVAVLLTHGVGL